MTPERWRQLETLYHAARTKPLNERSAYLAAACPGDAPMRRDVEALLNEPCPTSSWRSRRFFSRRA